jgi:hypothetical protein
MLKLVPSRIQHFAYLLKLQRRVASLHFPGIFLQRLYFELFEKKRLLSASTCPSRRSSQSNLMLTAPPLVSPGNYWNITFFFHREILRNNFSMEHEMARAYESSARRFGHKTNFIDTPLARETIKSKDLFSYFLDLNTTHLILLGDTKTSEHPGLNIEMLRTLRSQGIKVIVVIMDLLFTNRLMGKDLVEFWMDESDVMVVHNSRILEYFPDLDNILLWPSLPYPEDESIFKQDSLQDIDLLIPGSDHRQRGVFASYVEKRGVRVASKLSNRITNNSQSYSWEHYLEQIKKAKLVFTNGYRNSRESQVIARTTEVMLAKSVLLYETGSDIDYFFEPYYDYIPIHSLPDLTEKTNFLLNNHSLRDQIRYNSFNTISTKYSYKRFWNLLESKID